MKEEIIPPARLGPCIQTLFVLGLCFGLLVMGATGWKAFIILTVGITVCLAIGPRAIPGATSLRLTPHGMYLSDYFLPSFYRWDQVERFEVAKKELLFPPFGTTREAVFIHVPENGETRSIALPPFKIPSPQLLELLTHYKQQSERSPQAGQIPPPLPSRPNAGIFKAFTIAGYSCAVLALAFCPPIFGTAGFTIGTFLARKGVLPHANFIRILSVVLGIVGFFIGLAITAWEETQIKEQKQEQVDFWKEFNKPRQ